MCMIKMRDEAWTNLFGVRKLGSSGWNFQQAFFWSSGIS